VEEAQPSDLRDSASFQIPYINTSQGPWNDAFRKVLGDGIGKILVTTGFAKAAPMNNRDSMLDTVEQSCQRPLSLPVPLDVDSSAASAVSGYNDASSGWSAQRVSSMSCNGRALR